MSGEQIFNATAQGPEIWIARDDQMTSLVQIANTTWSSVNFLSTAAVWEVRLSPGVLRMSCINYPETSISNVGVASGLRSLMVIGQVMLLTLDGTQRQYHVGMDSVVAVITGAGSGTLSVDLVFRTTGDSVQTGVS